MIMHNIAATVTHDYAWFAAVGNDRSFGSWDIYTPTFNSIPVTKRDFTISRDMRVLMYGNQTAVVSDARSNAIESPYVQALNALTAKISEGSSPAQTPELVEAAERALASNVNNSSIADWAKKLAASTFSR